MPIKIKDIKGYENYMITEDGRVFSKNRNKYMALVKTTDGYWAIGLYMNSKLKSFKVHRLVADAFIPNPLGRKEINHIDGNKKNNHVSNLEWSTRSENVKHSFDTGLRKPNNHRFNKKVLDTVTGRIYDRMKDAAKAIGVSESYFGQMLNGQYPNNTNFIKV